MSKVDHSRSGSCVAGEALLGLSVHIYSRSHVLTFWDNCINNNMKKFTQKNNNLKQYIFVFSSKMIL